MDMWSSQADDRQSRGGLTGNWKGKRLSPAVEQRISLAGIGRSGRSFGMDWLKHKSVGSWERLWRWMWKVKRERERRKKRGEPRREKQESFLLASGESQKQRQTDRQTQRKRQRREKRTEGKMRRDQEDDFSLCLSVSLFSLPSSSVFCPFVYFLLHLFIYFSMNIHSFIHSLSHPRIPNPWNDPRVSKDGIQNTRYHGSLDASSIPGWEDPSES